MHTDNFDQKKRASLMPVPTFSTFVLSLASSGLVQLGETPDPASGERQLDLGLARQTIEILTMLREKTTGNLNSDETEILNALLYELQMKFVLKSR